MSEIDNYMKYISPSMFFAVSGEINIARGKPTTHSSEGRTGSSSSSFRAVDGNLSPSWSDGSCSQTGRGSKLKHFQYTR